MSSTWTAPRPRVKPHDERALEHAALASPVRLRLLDELVARPGPSHIDDLATGMGLHESTVRGHLIILQDAGFVEQVVEHAARPGRPRVLYGATSKSRVGTAGCLGYRTLANVLSAYLHREARDPAATGERAGQAWAAHLTEHVPTVRRSQHDALDRTRQVLENVGFSSELAGEPDQPVLVHRTCPFAGVVDEHGQVVCGLHKGLLEGLLEAFGARPVTTELTVASVPGDPCLAQLRGAADEW
ncbi:MAG: helix-turn-helix transcriptional regulator [Nitriliruptoraceae bacterium]